MGVLIAGVWMMALFSGGVLTLGLIALVIGRVPFNMLGEAWTPGEARRLGAVWTVVGATYAIYGLLGGVVLGIEHETPAANLLIGHWWGFFVPMIPGLVLISALLIQFEIYKGHQHRVRGGGWGPRRPDMPSSESELRWAIDEFQGGLRRRGPYSPDGLETRLDCHPQGSGAWEDLTPLARNEWICWVLWPKKAETRNQHIQRVRTELLEGKRRPCCWLGCTHRTDKEVSPSVRWVLSRRGKASA